MATKDTRLTQEHTNFSRLTRIVVELLRDVLWQVLTSKIPEKDIRAEISKQRRRLNLPKSLIAKILSHHVWLPCNSDFDISTLYDILRNACPNLKPPTHGWVVEANGNYPTAYDIKIGDDIERIRMIRNRVQGHAKEARLTDAPYNQQISEITAVVKRMDGRIGKNNNNTKFLVALQSCSISEDQEKEFLEWLLKEWEFDETTRDMTENLTGQVDQLVARTDMIQEEQTQMSRELKSSKTESKGHRRSLKKIEEVQKQHHAKIEQLSEKSEDVGDQVSDVKKNTKEGLKKISGVQKQQQDKIDQLSEKTEVVEDEITHLKKKTKDSIVSGATQIFVNQSISNEVGMEGQYELLTTDYSASKGTGHRQTYAEVTAKTIQTSNEKVVKIHNQVNQVNVTVNNGSYYSQLPSKQRDDNIRRFLNATKHFDDGHYILITEDQKRNKFLEPIALVPWVAVFDFDCYSRSRGLLSVVEEKLTEYNRSLHINCLQDRNLNNINENSTHWMFCRGCRENANSNEFCTFDEWQEDADINTGLKSFCKMLAKFSNAYTKYTVIVLLQNQSSLGEFVLRLMTKLKKYLKADFVLVKPEIKEGETLSFIEQMILHQFKNCLSTMFLDMRDMCETIAKYFSDTNGKKKDGIELPTMDKQNKVDIDAKQMAWLEEDLTVLYGNKKRDPSSVSQEMLEKECDNFFKGGTLPWFVWYKLEAGHVDVKRDITDDIIKSITTKFIHKFTSGLVTLFHAPGCGGTTLAQRILWDMKKQTPCAQEKLRSNSTVEDLVSRLDFLYEKTGLPILLLTDGEDCQRVDHLLRCLKKAIVIVLFVRRYAYTMTKHFNTDDTFWLGSYVSSHESTLLAIKLGNQCRCDEKKRNIDLLAEEVRKGKKKSIYEFGLAAYSYEYKGLESYVRGYLKLKSNHQREKYTLDPWYCALCRLSLAWYYGHIGIACKFFTGIANIKWRTSRDVPTLEDFPENLQNLIVKDETENRTNIIRVSNYFVAKEILEQILPWPEPRPVIRQMELCFNDIKDLQRHAIELIKYAAQMDRGEHDSTVVKILARIFIIREQTIDRHGSGKQLTELRTNKVSQIFQDLSKKPDYMEMFTVMEQLTQSFPKDPHFFVHLGRFYAMFKPTCEREAESNFETALTLCETLTAGQEIDQMTYHMRISFSITHFMYANMYRRRLAVLSGSKPTRKTRTKIDDFISMADRLLHLSQVARTHYQDSRKYDPDFHSKIISFVHEIHVCLMFCDFLLKNGGYPDIIQFIINQGESPVSKFADECIYEIDELFIEYFSTVEPDEVDDTVKEYQQWYLALFKDTIPTHERLLIRKDSIHASRIRIAEIKLRYGSETNIYSSLEDIQFEREMLDIIMHYEQIFADVHERDMYVKVTSLEQDYREWLIAVRSKLITNPYTIENVLKNVAMWDRKLHTPMSKFYQFILTSILGFGSEESLGDTHKLIEAQQLKEDVTKYRHALLKIKYPKEWLGRGKGIQQMVHGARFFGGIAERSDQDKKSGHVQTADLALMKGTIKHPNNNPRGGFISLDLGKVNNISVDVFFVPINFKMHFKSFAQARVEFNIGFTFTHGYEAYNIKELQKITCTGCKMDVEVTSRDRHVVCQCGQELTPTVSNE